MTTALTEQTLLELNAQYLRSKPIILTFETKLKQGLDDLALSQHDFAFALDFVQDHVTLFRFLNDADFDESIAYGRIMDTILWRIEIKIDQLAWDTIHPGFYVCCHDDHPAFSFFHKQDRFDRPVVVVRMRHFPNFGDLTISDTIPPFACLVMEMARKWTLELTRRNELQQLSQDDMDLNNNNTLFDDELPLVLVSQIVVVIDISKSPIIPLEKRLIQELQIVTDDRFPGFFGSIYILNFGWIYQGLWQMVKLMLSEHAKSKINFPSADQVKEYIPEENLLRELGGSDDYEWTLDNDIILQKYGNGWKMETPQPPSFKPMTPPRSPILSTSRASVVSPGIIPTTRSSRSLSTTSFTSDDFYDAPGSPLTEEFDQQQQQQQQQSSIWHMTSSAYGTPGALTPIGIRSPSQWISTSSTSTNHYFLDIPSFLASFFRSSSTNIYTSGTTNNHHDDGVCGVDLTYRLTNLALEQQQQQDEEGVILENTETLLVVKTQQQQTIGLSRRRSIPGDHPPHFPHLLPPDASSMYAGDSLRIQLRRSEQRLIRLTRRLFRLSFAYHGTLYWVLLYIFLRGPVENSMRRVLTKIMINSHSRTITLTSVGLVASVAGGLGASLSYSLGH